MSSKTLQEFAFSEIKEFVRIDVEVFSPNDVASKVIGVLRELNHDEAVVKSDDNIGLITIRDLFEVIQPQITKIGDLPNNLWKAYKNVSPVARVFEVVKSLIELNVRALPVVEDGKALGFICQTELYQALEDIPETADINVSEIVKTPLITMNSNDEVSSARRTMLDKDISHIPIVSDGKLVGIVTSKGLVDWFITPIGVQTVGERLGEINPRFEGKLSGVMDKNPLTCGKNESALNIIKKMKSRDVGACVVTFDERPVGIITPRELLKPLLRFVEPTEAPVSIVGLEDEDFFERQVAEEKVRRLMERVDKVHPHLLETRIKVNKFNLGGERARYEAEANVFSKVSKETFHVTKGGWDLMKLFDELCDTLEKSLLSSKHVPRKYSPEDKYARRESRLR